MICTIAVPNTRPKGYNRAAEACSLLIITWHCTQQPNAKGTVASLFIGDKKRDMTWWWRPGSDGNSGTRRGTNSCGNRYNTPGGTNTNNGSYHYSNKDGSHYYANDNGSTCKSQLIPATFPASYSFFVQLTVPFFYILSFKVMALGVSWFQM